MWTDVGRSRWIPTDRERSGGLPIGLTSGGNLA